MIFFSPITFDILDLILMFSLEIYTSLHLPYATFDKQTELEESAG